MRMSGKLILLVSLVALSGDRRQISADACGGFFCQQIPINQAAEQIIFRQDGTTVTAIVLIQYQGAAEDFSWVVPVPGTPEFSLSSAQLFQTLETTTRPQFTLDVTGDACPDLFRGGAVPLASPAGDDSLADEDGGVEIVEELAVGPFDIQIVSSADATAMATWLIDNDYDLTERGTELIAPYVEAGMNFVALRLRQDQGAGDVQPLRMVYQSERPMIPIRLTAVAAEPDMGVLVWLLGPGRAVPVNYLHVIPNYAQLNWYNGTRTAYGSYQNLVTAAMDEVGGQGFATDYASASPDLQVLRDQPATLRAEIERLAGLPDDEAVAQALNFGLFPGTQVLEILRRRLPLPDGTQEFVYGNPSLLRATLDAGTIATGAAALRVDLETEVVAPLEDSLSVFDGDPYLTRMYTTLSPEEMTLDPVFGFNTELSGQPLERRATLDVRCLLGTTDWSLTLGAGTGREGELVMQGSGAPPFVVPDELAAQSAVKTAEFLRESSSDSDVVTDTRFDPVRSGGVPLLGACGTVPLLATLTGLWMYARRWQAGGRPGA